MQADEGRISRLEGRFEDDRLEQEYLHIRMVQTRSFLRIFLMAATILYLLFTGCNLFSIPRSELLQTILVRLFTSGLIIFFILFVIGRQSNAHRTMQYIAVIEVIFMVGYFLTAYRYEVMNYYLKAMDLVIISIVLFTVPNRFVYAAGIVMISYIFFLFQLFLRAETLLILQRISLTGYLLIALLLIAFVSLRGHNNDRKQYFADKQVKDMLMIDPLTGAFNRRKMREEMDKWLPFCTRYGLPFSLLMLDIDDFKLINDTYGHIYGDQVLQELTLNIRKEIRDQDIVVRIGGEEFVVLLPNTDEKSAVRLAERLRAAIHSHLFLGGRKVTCSMGVSSWVQGMTAQELLDLADRRLYTAKRRGKNRVAYTEMPEELTHPAEKQKNA